MHYLGSKPKTRLELKYYVDDKLLDDITAKFNMFQTVYIVRKKWRKIHIIKDQIAVVCFTNMISYKTEGGNNILEDHLNIFDNKEDAYKYAEQINRRKNIKFKSVW